MTETFSSRSVKGTGASASLNTDGSQTFAHGVLLSHLRVLLSEPEWNEGGELDAQDRLGRIGRRPGRGQLRGFADTLRCRMRAMNVSLMIVDT